MTKKEIHKTGLREPGLKTTTRRRSAIPESFKISKSPMQTILQDLESAQKNDLPIDSNPELTTSSTRSSLHEPVVNLLTTESTNVVNLLTTHQNQELTTSSEEQLTTSSKLKTRLQKQSFTYEQRGVELVGIRYPKETHYLIKELCLRYGIDKTEFFNSVVNYALSLPEIELTTLLGVNVVNKLTHDDMMIFKTHEDIIMRFELYTNRKWTRRDDREGVRYNDTDIRLIEIAFIATIDKKLLGNTARQPIKSFNYFTTEIDILIQQQKDKELPANLDDYHKYVLSTWEKRIRKLRDSKWLQNA